MNNQFCSDYTNGDALRTFNRVVSQPQKPSLFLRIVKSLWKNMPVNWVIILCLMTGYICWNAPEVADWQYGVFAIMGFIGVVWLLLYVAYSLLFQRDNSHDGEIAGAIGFLAFFPLSLFYVAHKRSKQHLANQEAILEELRKQNSR